MAAGDYTITFGGLTIGAGTPYQIMSVSGLEELPELRSGDLTRGFADGETAGLDLLGGRDITLELNIFDSGTGDFFDNVERVKAMSTPSPEVPFTFQLPGRLARTLNARARRRSLPVDLEYSFRKANAFLQFHATDPRIYDQAWTTVNVGLPTASGGLTFDAVAPFVFGVSGTGGSLVAVNSGNFPAPWLATFTGPLVNPSIIRTDTGSIVRWNGTLNAGDTLTIDSLARAVVLNGTASRYSLAVAQWFALPPALGPLAANSGNTTVQFGAASGTGTLAFSYRSTRV